MSDEMWRRRDSRGDDSETDEFGGPLFPDDPADDHPDERGEPTGERRLRFGPDDTGPLPHWTAPPTGEIPRIASPEGADVPDDDDADEVDVWSTFTTESPVWRDDDPATVTGVMDAVPNDFAAPPDRGGGYDAPSGQIGRTDHTGGYGADYGPDPSGEFSNGVSRPIPRSADRGRDPSGSVPIPRREPGRITIGTDPSGTPRRQPEPGRRRGGPPPRAGGRGPRPGAPGRGVAAPGARSMPNAVIAGVVLAAVFVAALMINELIVLGIVVVILAVGAYEYFGKVTEKGYRPAIVPGLLACALMPIAAYNMGERALPLALALTFVAAAVGFIGAKGTEAGPLPNMAITTMGVVWIGLLGSYAGLILRMSTGTFELKNVLVQGGADLGTNTLFMIALGVAANDIGALVVGSAAGKTALRAWVSPSKTLEGLIGGTLATFLALFVASKINDNGTWIDMTDVLLLSLVIAVFAPLGDLTESMFKRNLDIKDFGTIVQGHGGVLDRFDGFLFALPASYYLTLVIFSNNVNV